MCVVSSAVNKTENKKSPDEITEIEKLGSFQVRTGKPNITIQQYMLSYVQQPTSGIVLVNLTERSSFKRCIYILNHTNINLFMVIFYRALVHHSCFYPKCTLPKVGCFHFRLGRHFLSLNFVFYKNLAITSAILEMERTIINGMNYFNNKTRRLVQENVLGFRMFYFFFLHSSKRFYLSEVWCS